MFPVTSHKAQGWTADHVVVAVERLTAKGAYMACSRGRQSCTQKVLENACRVGAFVASHDGATPLLPPEIIQEFNAA